MLTSLLSICCLFPFICVKGNQLIGFTSFIYEKDSELPQNDKNLFNSWPEFNENGFFNYYIYNRKTEEILLPIEGIYYLSANLIIKTNSDAVDVTMYFMIRRTKKIVCETFKAISMDSTDTISISCFARVKEMTEIDFIISNSKDISVLIGSSIGIQYVGLPGVVSSFVMPLENKDNELVIKDELLLNEFLYFNTFSVINNLKEIAIECDSLYLISINAILGISKKPLFKVSRNVNETLLDQSFSSSSQKTSLIFFSALKLQKGDVISIEFQNLYFYDNSVYSIIKLDEVNENDDYFSLQIPQVKFQQQDYSYEQARVKIPLSSTSPYFSNGVKLDEKEIIQLETGGIYFISSSFSLTSSADKDFSIVLNVEDGLDDMTEQMGFKLTYQDKKVSNGLIKLQMNGIIELKKKSIISFVIISAESKTLEIIEPSSLFMMPVPSQRFQGNIQIKELEKNVLICSENGNIIKGFDDGFDRAYVDQRNTFLNKYATKSRDGYRIPTSGIYFYSMSMILSSSETQNGNISVRILSSEKALVDHQTSSFSLFSNTKETVTISNIMNLNKDFEIQVLVKCKQKIQIQDGIDFKILLLKSTEKSLFLSLPINPNATDTVLYDTAISGTFTIPAPGTYLVHVQQPIVFRNIKGTLNYVTIDVYQQSKTVESGASKRLYFSDTTNSKNGMETLSITDIINVDESDGELTINVRLTLKKTTQGLIVSYKDALASFYKFSSFYGFKAKQNSPKLLPLINNQVSLGNLKFHGDGGFIYPTTNFFGRSNFIVYKTMTVFYSVLIETKNVKAGSLMLAFLLRPSGRRIEVSPYVKGKSWLLLEAYGTLDLQKGEVLQLTIESSVAEQVLVSKSSWAMLELVNPLMPVYWINKVTDQFKEYDSVSSVFLVCDGVNKLTVTRRKVNEINTFNSILIGKEILSIDQWNNDSYKLPFSESECTTMFIFAQSNANSSNDINLLVRGIEDRSLVMIPAMANQNSFILCLKRDTVLTVEKSNENSTANVSIIPIHYHYSMEAFSSVVPVRKTISVDGNNFKRIDEWTTNSNYFFKNTENFRDMKGAYYVKENGYYVINVNVKFFHENLEQSGCVLLIQKDGVNMMNESIFSNKSIVYNNLMWLRRLSAIQIGLKCDVSIQVNIFQESIFSVLLLDSHPTFDSSCSNTASSLLINATKPTIFIQSNTNFSLECYSSQNSFADFYWYKNGSVIFETIGGRKSILLLENITQEDDGVYFCLSQTGMMDKQSKSVSLIIIDPTPLVKLSNDTVFVEENYVVNKLLAWIRVDAKNPETNAAAKVALSIIDGDDDSNLYFAPSVTKEFSTIYFRNPFNFERKQIYQLTIQAENIDFETNSKAASFITLRVIVVNRNDHLPVFSKEIATFSIKENSKIGAFVCTIKATDLDVGSNENTQYSLLSTKYSSLFRINKQTGEIFVAGRIDYEETSNIKLMVSVDDGTYTSFKEVLINVIDKNDNRPHFSKDFYSVNITVETKINTKVFELTAYDKDSGKYGEISFSIVDGNDMDTFRIVNNSIVLNRKLEDEKRYQLYVTAVDGGNLYCFNPAYVYINVAEIPGINIPVFEKPVYELFLDEGTPVPVHLINLRLTKNKFKMVTFKAETLPFIENAVEISTEGVLTLKKVMDYEKTKYLPIIVSACVVIKKKEACGTAYVTVTIRDINDNPPYFLQSFYTVSIKDSVQVGDSIIKLEARDEDSGENGKFRFFLHNFNSIFSVDKFDGTVSLVKQFNRTIFSSFKLYVEVRDNGKPALNSHCYVGVLVESPVKFVTSAPIKLKKKEEIPLIENWMFWVITVAVLLLIIIPVAIIALCMRYKRMKREMVERLKLREENSNHEVKGLMNYLSKPAESVECMLSFSCETIPSAYSSKRNISTSKHSVNGDVLVHSSENWNDTLTSEEDQSLRNDSLDDNSQKALLNGSAIQRNGRFRKM